jgi:hypothetical protein
MKTVISISPQRSKIGEELWPQALRIAPYLLGNPLVGHVLETNAEAVALRAFLASHGFVECNHSFPTMPEKHVMVHRRRVYDEADLKNSPFLYVRRVKEQPTYILVADKLARQAFKSRARPVAEIFGEDDTGYPHRIWMLTSTIEHLKATKWKGVMFKQALGRDPYVAAASYHVWEGAKELSSTVVLPPVVRDITRVAIQGKLRPVTHEPVDWIGSLFDEGFNDVLPRFYANELPPLDSWDIAISHEYFLQKQKQDRMIFVSQRVRRQLVKAKLDHLLQWTPCGIEPGDRPTA